MRNPRSKLTDRLELLRLPQRFFRALPLGDLRGQSFVCGSEAAGSFGHAPFEFLSATRQGLARLDDVGYVGAGAEPSDACTDITDIVKVSRASTMSVKSVQVPNHLTIRPLSRTGVPRALNQRYWPSARRILRSASYSSCPFTAAIQRSRIRSRSSG